LAKFSLTRAAQVAIPIAVLALAAAETARRSLTENPANPKYWAKRAAEAENRNESPVPALTRAVELAPREAIYASRLGLAHEAEGDLVLAEFALRRGAELSRKYEPQWNLLNFFFRRARWDDFWAQAATTLAISFGDHAALFDLCTRADGGTDRLERILPATPQMKFAYASFLMSRADYARAGPVVESLANSASGDDLITLRAWCDTLLENFEVGAAERAWKSLRARGLLNEDVPPWQTPDVKGATVHGMPDGMWHILLTGEQPEQCTLLTRVVPTQRRSRLEWTIEAELSASSGLTWLVESYERSPRVLARSGELRGGAGVLDFDAAGGPVRVTLQFKRPLGSVRAEGRVTINNLRVTEPRP
jgi:hypothetical protein